jgi:putative SOS response-associated peptidase YedK
VKLFNLLSNILSYSNGTDWIKSSKHLSDVLNKLYPFPSDMMNAYPVSDMVNLPDANEPSMVNPLSEKTAN